MSKTGRNNNYKVEDEDYGIDKLDISTEMPEYEDVNVPKEKLLVMLKTIIKNTKANLTIMELYVNELEKKLNA